MSYDLGNLYVFQVVEQRKRDGSSAYMSVGVCLYRTTWYGTDLPDVLDIPMID